MHSAKNT